jgi:anti-sigma-K factor RskA
VDRSGQSAVDKSVGGWRSVVATPPMAAAAGVTVAALNTYKKNFLKNLLH